MGEKIGKDRRGWKAAGERGREWREGKREG